MFIRLFVLELHRLVLGWRFVAALLIMLALSAYSLYSAYQGLIDPSMRDQWPFIGVPPTVYAQGALSVHASQWLALTAPLVAGLVAAGSLAADRRRGYVQMVLARGVSRWNYMLAKGGAMAMSAAFAVFLGGLIFMLLARGLLLPDRPPLEQRLLIKDEQGNQIIAPTYSYIPSPYPTLFEHNPVLGDLASLAIVALGAAALALTGLIVGALVSSEYIALVVPFAVVVLGLLFFTIYADAISPYTYMEVWNRYPNRMLPGTPPFIPFVYWLVFGALAVGVGGTLFTRREVS